jgi:hypothetical protein
MELSQYQEAILNKELIALATKTDTGVDVDQVQKPIDRAAKNTGTKVATQCQKAIELLQQKNLAELEEIAWRVNNTGVQLLEGDSQCRQSLINALVANLVAKNIHPLALQYLCRRHVIVQEASSVEVSHQEPKLIAQVAENTSDVEIEPVQEDLLEILARLEKFPRPKLRTVLREIVDRLGKESVRDLLG